MGSSETSVVSRVVGLVAARLPAIRLPMETSRAPMRPVKGAVMRQYSRSSWASRIWALASSIAACAEFRSAVRWSTVSAVAKLLRCSDWERTSSLLASRSEEHTSELQSRLHLVCRLLLEKKKTVVDDGSTLLINNEMK